VQLAFPDNCSNHGAKHSLDSGSGSEDGKVMDWRGWTIISSPEGRLFFYHEGRQESQWQQPSELCDILGEWTEVISELQPGKPRFWRNDVLQISLCKDPRGTTNIFQAALDGNAFFLHLYAESEGDLDVVDPRGRSALHFACAGGATPCAVFLLQRMANINCREATGSTPLIHACRYGHASIVKVLLENLADLHMANDFGNTALHEAVCMGQFDCVRLLLMHGAKQSCKNEDGDTAMDIAEKRKHNLCRAYLQRHELSLSSASNENSEQIRFSDDIQPLSGKDVFEMNEGFCATTTSSPGAEVLACEDNKAQTRNEMEFGCGNTYIGEDETDSSSVSSGSENGDDEEEDKGLLSWGGRMLSSWWNST